MPIVISEFEILPEQLPAAPPPSAQADAAAPRLPTPRELVLAIRQQARRDARVRAD